MPTIFELLNTTQRGGFGPSIEILCNAICPRSCPCCNQQSFMAAYPDYEYTLDDARQFLRALSENGIKVGVVFSGGEPSRWSFLWEVLSLFGSSPNISSIRVTTSDDDPTYIIRLKTMTDKIYFSHRPDHHWSRHNPPAYMGGVNIWSAENHVVWPTERWNGPTVCCCRNVGIIASVMGQGVYPCVVSLNMKERGHWDDLEPVSLSDYFSGKVSIPPIGTYEACRFCVNNDVYRSSNPPTYSTEKKAK